ncbi:dihydroxyacetone kinase family protein [Microbacterium paludicola]|uniref:Dihydroxyacetone kinase family protein n=1 Tax=Microbacterium paludicola TaxID=300019 RepID=A0A4Y9FUE7_9MICO|nr:dihydroxyacetone kinase family protein [Microbacterium paludicola]MBF0816468.1 dihydroxyacetone kinase family protein [Microbacterium paludicola]TFU32882.1 dihydroxyacetone kinase family protein [Microbacterium paludicola]
MTRLFNDPAAFADEMTQGFADAASRWVQRIPGGVVRSTRSEDQQVALVIGGGSGHYPAFGGLVGPGIAHGAAMGNLFASPSAHQVYSVAKAADQGRGVLLSYGNYAGDVLHFTQAQDRLNAEGHDVRTVLVTDDIWSAPRERIDQRRGIAGDLAVFKVAGAAAEAGYDLDGVERVARLANARTRSFGVAFSGCTLPGADAPLFEVPEGRMAVGLGIHGEPGIDEVDIPTAAGLAEMFVTKLLEELPDGVSLGGARVVPILNGLGSVKYEELFVVYRTVHRLLAERGAVVVEPEVGELCTSFDMAGCSLTLLWLDEELETLWTAPADTPGYRKGSVAPQRHVEVHVDAADEEQPIGPASDESRALGRAIADGLDAVAGALDDAADDLGRMDQVAGDGDHGIGMQRGSRAARDAAHRAVDGGAGARTVLAHAAEAWSDKAGGTSGAIWAEILRTVGEALGDESTADAAAVATGVTAAKDAVMAFGKAKVGDKTMVDAMVPFADALAAAVAGGRGLADAWDRATTGAEGAAQGTADLVATLGRARSHGEKSIGTPDPGAVSFALVCRTIHRTLG